MNKVNAPIFQICKFHEIPSLFIAFLLFSLFSAALIENMAVADPGQSSSMVSLLEASLSVSPSLHDYKVERNLSPDGVEYFILRSKTDNSSFSLIPDKSSIGRILHVTDSNGNNLYTYQINPDSTMVKIFGSDGALLRAFVAGADKTLNDITPTGMSAFPAADFISKPQETSFLYLAAAMFQALYKGLSESKSGVATYRTSGYVFTNSINSVELRDVLNRLKVVGPPTELDDETLKNSSIYFPEYSAGDIDSGVTINRGDLTSSWATVPVIRGNNPVSLSLFYNTNSACPRTFISLATKLRNREIPENSYISVCGAVERVTGGFHESECRRVYDFAINVCTDSKYSKDILVVDKYIPPKRDPIDGNTLSVKAETILKEEICEDFPEIIASKIGKPKYYEYNLNILAPNPTVSTATITLYATDTADINTARESFIWNGLMPGTGSPLPTGSYKYEMTFSEVFQYTKNNAVQNVKTFYKIPKEYPENFPRVLLRNEIYSPFGAGWTLGGIQYIFDTENNDGNITLADGDGSIKEFKELSTNPDFFIGPEGNFSFIQRKSEKNANNLMLSLTCGGVSDSWDYWRKLKDGTILFYKSYDQQRPADARISSILDRNCNRTVYSYEDAAPGRVQCVFLPTHPCTKTNSCSSCSKPDGAAKNDAFHFDYSAAPNVVITDPAGRSSTLGIAANCNGGANPNPSVCRITNPDGSYVTYKYDAQNRLVEKNDPRTDVDDITTYSYSLPMPGGGSCDALGNVEKITFPDNRPDFPSTREFVRSISGADEKPYRDLANYWLQCEGKGASPDSLVPLTELENLATVVYENRGAGAKSMYRVYKTNAFGSMTGFTDAMGHYSIVKRNEDNLPETIIDSGQAFTKITYDAVGNVLTKAEPNRGTVTFQYDPLFNQITSQTDPLGYVSTVDYDGRGNPVLATGPDGRQASTQYYAPGEAGLPLNGLVKSATDGANSAQKLTTAFKYDPDTANTTESDPPGALEKTFTAYQGGGADYRLIGLPRTATVWGPAIPRTTEFSYDTLNNRTLSTLSPHDDSGARLRTCFGYDTAGNRTWVLDPRHTSGGCPAAPTDQATLFSYDEMNRLLKMQKPALDGFGREEEITEYNPLGQIARASWYGRNAASRDSHNWVTYSYDPIGQLIEERTTDESLASSPVFYTVYSYDTQGRGRITHVRSDYAELAFDYNDAGDLLTTETFTHPNAYLPETESEPGYFSPIAQPYTKLTFSYDAAGRRVSMLEETGGDEPPLGTYYEYDPAGRASLITGGPGRLSTAFHYDGLGRRAAMTRAFGSRTMYSYNDEGLLDGVFAYNAANDEINRFEYGYDPAGRRTAMTTRDYDVDYEYDGLDRLIKSDYKNFGKPGSSLTAAQLKDDGFTYDANGNRTEYTKSAPDAPAETATYDATASPLNRLASDGTWSYEYDHNGNMKRKTSVADAHVFWKYYYDYKNRMTGAERFEPDAAGTNAERTRAVRYIYDPLGRRIMKGVKDGVQDIALNRWTLMRKYIYDGDDIVQEYTWDDVAKADRLTSRWTHGPGVDEPLVWWYDSDQMDTDTALKPFFYHFDGLGSVTAITGSAGEIVAKYVYDSFGDTVQQCGTLAARNFYQYTSREYDPETDLHYYRARTYDRRLGGFYQEDPKWDANLYWYVDDNPVMSIDPFGQSPTAGVPDVYVPGISPGTYEQYRSRQDNEAAGMLAGGINAVLWFLGGFLGEEGAIYIYGARTARKAEQTAQIAKETKQAVNVVKTAEKVAKPTNKIKKVAKTENILKSNKVKTKAQTVQLEPPKMPPQKSKWQSFWEKLGDFLDQ